MESPNKCLNEVTDILRIFRYNTISPYFGEYLNGHLNWVSTINCDQDFYDPRNRERLTQLKNFLEDPDDQMTEYDLESIQEYVDMKNAFIQRIHNYDGVFRSTTGYRMDEFFIEIVSDLETILERIPPSDYPNMKEENREFYLQLNKYILNPKHIEKMSEQFDIGFFDYLDAIM
jgi:hypothetical protein